MTQQQTQPRLLARFANRSLAEGAMTAVQSHGPPARSVELLTPPTTRRAFDARRIKHGVLGAFVGGGLGALAAALLAPLMNVDQGLIVGGGGIILTGALIGAMMIGTLGLIAGFGLGEAKTPAKVTEVEAQTDQVSGEVLVRVHITPGADVQGVRNALRTAGALEVGRESRSSLPDEEVLAFRTVPAT